MVKNSPLACIFLMLQGVLCAQPLFVVLLDVLHPVGSDGQEQPTGSHLPHLQGLFCHPVDSQERPAASYHLYGTRIMEHFKPTSTVVILSSSGHNMFKPHCSGRREQGPFPPSATCSGTDSNVVSSSIENFEMSKISAMF
ncbi:hypothetical protein B0H16DRAFT_1486518 [Mycena metata]|uniref:Secreted protein n=1 Tax=Mycena metata TaxID=1033252 RepID=A0AAD7DIR4_9AGAR|nr:hypothetical protein B0H16DRAFT_1486518 [Mycena metata]